MKIWCGFGSEHSANLVMIGTFKDSGSAREAESIINEATEASREDEAEGLLSADKVARKLTDRMLEVMTDHNFHAFGYGDPEQLLFDFDIRREGDRVIITTDEYDVQALFKVLVDKGARVEMYSAHFHGGTGYGR